MKPQETLFQGRPGGFRETQGEKPGWGASGTGEKGHTQRVWAWNFPGALPGGYESLPESATLKDIHRE